jgi:antitoxin component HigA of HigAB toxin-antitoxin module
MNIKPIRSDDDLRAAFLRLESIFQAQEGSPEADEMEVLATLIEAYEQKHYPIGPADPVEAIKFRMEQQGRRKGAKTQRRTACPEPACREPVESAEGGRKEGFAPAFA